MEKAPVVSSEHAPGLFQRLYEALAWRYRFRYRTRLKRLFGVRRVQWCRVISDRASETFVRSLAFTKLDALEVSPDNDRWKNLGFRSYRSTSYPEYDLCAGPLQAEAFDVVIVEQVLEHVHWPLRAVRSLHQMLRPGGWLVAATPFLLRIHGHPDDCSRWTEMGLKHLLVEGGFAAADVRTGAWGNRACIKGNFRNFVDWIPWWHSLRNEPEFPMVVWAFAQKAR